MKKLYAFALIALAITAFSCSDDTTAPPVSEGGPSGVQGADATLQDNCEEAYAAALSPVLLQWEEAIEAYRDLDFLDTPPTFTDGMTITEYATALSPVLVQWQTEIEAWKDSSFLDTVPVFSDQSTSEYFAALSPVLVQWKVALEDMRGESFLDDPPTYNIDTTAPAITCLPDTTISCEGDSTVFEFEVTATDDCDPDPTVMCDPPSGSKFPTGTTTVTCTAVDVTGNMSECTFDVTVSDEDAPMISCPSDTTIECAGSDGTVYEFVVVATDLCDDTVQVVCEPPSGSAFPLGETVVTCTATDDSGNTSECTFTVTVQDTEGPLLVCANDTTLVCEGPDGAVLVFTSSATDACDPDPAVNCDPPSGSTFPLGETMVMCSASDASGNESNCSFIVTVVDTTPPVIDCPDDIEVECEGLDGTTVTFEATATDDCDDNPTVVCDPPSGTTFPLGTTMVMCTAMDASGNTSTCSFMVEVIDETPPVIQDVTASPSMLWPPNHKMIDIDINVDASDVCGGTPQCWITGVTSNEEINGKGDGNTEPDWEIMGDLTLRLRAERSGRGSSRVYTVHVRCMDPSGNFNDETVNVTVAHDQGRRVSRGEQH